MCFDPNAKIAAVRPSDYGYDVKLTDNTVGNVANNAKDPYYDEVQSYLAKTTPSSDPLAGQPPRPTNIPGAGGVGFNQVGDGRNGVQGITDTATGGRYGLGTRTTNGSARQSVVEGKRVSDRFGLGGRRLNTKK